MISLGVNGIDSTWLIHTSNTLELHATLSTPDLGTHVYVHVSCIKSYFALFGPKNLQLFILPCVPGFGMTNSLLLKAEWPGSMLAVSK